MAHRKLRLQREDTVSSIFSTTSYSYYCLHKDGDPKTLGEVASVFFSFATPFLSLFCRRSLHGDRKGHHYYIRLMPVLRV